MALQQTQLTTNETVFLGNVHKNRQATQWFANFFAFGTFASGTINWLWSPDGGTTKLAMTDYSGAAITSTADDSFGSNMGNGNTLTNAPKLYAMLTGAGTASITVGFFDNN